MENKLKQDRVWAPDPIDGYVLGYITDFNGEALEIEQAEQPGKVQCTLQGWSCTCHL